MTTHNNTAFPVDRIMRLPIIGYTVSKWRKRRIQLREHPTNPARLISIGDTFADVKDQMRVIADELRSEWQTALDYIAHGKVYTSE